MYEPEPWLRGPLPGVQPFVMPVLFSFLQVREDLAKHTEGLTSKQVWHDLAGGSVGFHLKHIAGSVDRLSTYLTGLQLTDLQLQALGQEKEADADLYSLLTAVHSSLAVAEEKLRSLRPEQLYEPRSVGRQHLPTTVIGLLVHLAEHTQRHLGQVITCAKAVRSLV